MSYKKENGEYLSADKRTSIKYSVFTPDSVPKAVVQVEHGMGSSVDSYERSGFVQRMTDAGFVVCGEDHLGHGGSICDQDDAGHFSDYRNLADDVSSLKTIIRGKYRHLPYIMYGHSLGSMIVRDYIRRYVDIDGAILSGTVGQGLSVAKRKRKAVMTARFRGERFKSEKLKNKFFDGFNEKLSDENDELSWLSSLPEVRDIYRKGGDGFCLTASGYREVYRLMESITDASWFDSVPLSLPIYIISGEDDPLGGNGEGIKTLYEELDNRELSNVKMKLYSGARHQILKDKCRDEVYSDVIEWINSVADGVAECNGMTFGSREV